MSSPLELHVIERDGDSIVLHPPTYTLFTVEKDAGNVLQAYAAGENPDAISARFNLPPTAVRQLIASVHGFLDGQEPISLDPAPYEPPDVLQKLELMVSNDCNLNCIYCYAQGGNYGREKALMSPETAVAAVDLMFDHFREIESVVFFGGEPLMNLPAIEAVCNDLQQKREQGKIKAIPALGIITNGTLITERAADLIAKFNIHSTVSVDGPKSINDKLRPFKNGAGSYPSIQRGINKLRARKVVPNFEFTYTQAHVESGIGPGDVLQHLHDALGFPEGFGSIGEADLPDDDPLNVVDPIPNFHAPLLDWTIQKFVDGKLISGDIALTITLQIIFKQARTHICPAGHKSLAITTEGNIFPCHILVDRDAFLMGNIRDPQWYESPAAGNIFRMLQYARKEENPYCKTCWARYVCAGCLGGWREEGTEQVFITKTRCDLKRKIWETIITKIMALKEDEAAWSKLENALKNVVEGRHARQSAGMDINNFIPLARIQNAGRPSSYKPEPVETQN